LPHFPHLIGVVEMNIAITTFWLMQLQLLFMLETNRPAFATQKDADTPVIAVEGTVFGGGPSDNAYSRIQIEGVNPTTRYTLKLSLKNDTTHDIEFDSVDTSCGCASFEPTSGVLRAGETFLFDLKFKSPESTSSGAYLFSATLGNAAQPSVRLLFNCKLQGNLHTPDNHHFKVEEGKSLFIPITITDPFKFSDLVAGISDSLRGKAELSLVERKGKYFAKLTINSEKMKDSETLSGRIDVLHPPSGSKASTEILARKSGDLDFSPNYLFFRPSDSENVRGTCNVILQLKKSNIDPNEKDVTISISVVDSTSTKCKFRIAKVTNLAVGLYRLKVEHLSDDDSVSSLDSLPTSLDVSVRFGVKAALAVETPCVFQY